MDSKLNEGISMLKISIITRIKQCNLYDKLKITYQYFSDIFDIHKSEWDLTEASNFDSDISLEIFCFGTPRQKH